MDEIERGDLVTTIGADGAERQLRALTGVVAGGDFAVVWACSEREWEASQTEDREPTGIPWPADDVRVTKGEAAPA